MRLKFINPFTKFYMCIFYSANFSFSHDPFFFLIIVLFIYIIIINITYQNLNIDSFYLSILIFLNLIVNMFLLWYFILFYSLLLKEQEFLTIFL